MDRFCTDKEAEPPVPNLNDEQLVAVFQEFQTVYLTVIDREAHRLLTPRPAGPGNPAGQRRFGRRGPAGRPAPSGDNALWPVRGALAGHFRSERSRVIPRQTQKYDI